MSDQATAVAFETHVNSASIGGILTTPQGANRFDHTSHRNHRLEIDDAIRAGWRAKKELSEIVADVAVICGYNFLPASIRDRARLLGLPARPHAQKFAWADPAHRATLKELWTDLSVPLRQMPHLMKKRHPETNFSRNALCGAAHRFGLPERTKAKTAIGLTPQALAERIERKRIICMRHQLKRQGKPTDVQPRVRPYKGREALIIDPAPVELFVPPEQRKQLVELERRHCRWPYGEPGGEDFYFCGGDSLDDGPYCCHHHRMGTR